jgi:hypothetical protein
MPIYIVDASNQESRISSFEEHGLSGCSPSTVPDCGIHIISGSPIPNSVATILAHIHDYAEATVTGSGFSEYTAQRNALRHYESVPVPQPVMMMNVKGFNDHEEFKRMGFQEETNLNFPGDFMITQHISYPDLKKIWSHGPDPFGTSLAGNVNPAGLFAFFMSWKAIGMYCHVLGGRFEQAPEQFYTVGATIDGREFAEGVVPMISMPSKNVPLKVSASNPDAVMGPTKVMAGIKPVIAPVRSVNTEKVFVSGIDFKPTTSGVLFPYFHDMLLPDGDYAAGVFLRYFINSIGDSKEAVFALAPIIRKGFKSLKASKAGREIQHIMFGIQSSIDVGAPIRIIVDKRVYRGFVLLGDGFGVTQRGQTITPTVRGILGEEISQLDSHGKAIARLTVIVASLGMKIGGRLMMWDEDRAKRSSRYLANELHKRSTKGTEYEEEINNLVASLRFGDVYWTIDEGNTIKIFDCIIAGSIDEDQPFYLGGGMWNSDDSFARILSVFGDRAPTFSIRTGGKTMSIARPGETDPNLEGTPRKLPYLPIYKTGLLDAAKMWESIARTHSFRYVPSKAKGPGKLFDRKADVGHIAGEKFVIVYEKLRAFAYANRSGKRGIEVEVDEAIKSGERAAKKKAIASTAAGFM